VRAALGAAARRFLTLLAGIAAVTIVVSLLLGLAAGSGIHRSISVGFYVVGSFVTIAGFFIGNRGPARLKGEEHDGLLGPRRVRWATREERVLTLNESAILVTIGFVLLVIGTLVDDRVRLI
jgi:hypothetical protein